MEKRLRNLGKSLADCLWERVDRSGECWEWQGTRDPDGYGRFTYLTGKYAAHRVAWVLTYGDIPAGLFVCHACDNPPCVRPDHLWLGTSKANAVDAARKGRTASGDRNGARLYPDRVGEGVRRWQKERPERIARGERGGTAKLTANEVVEIRRLGGEGIRQVDIAERYRITQAHVSEILLRKVWKHLEEPHGQDK